MRHSHRGFSLIELLVVVSVIAVLVSLLLPGVGRIREASKALVCANNLRQFSVGLLTYASDNNGKWSAGKWNNDVQDYLSEGGAIGSITVAATNRMARCPSVPLRTSAGVTLDLSYAYTGVYWDTAGNTWNPLPANWYFAYKPGREARQVTNAKIVNRSNKVVLSEAWDDWGGSTGQATWGVNTLADGRPRLTHGVGCNVVCADGRVTRIALPGLTRRFNQNSSGAAIQGDTMWYPRNNGTSSYMK